MNRDEVNTFAFKSEKICYFDMSLSKEVLAAAMKAATEAALQAGSLLREFYKLRYACDEEIALGSATEETRKTFESGALGITAKTADTDLVTEYDKRCDALITQRLTAFQHELSVANIDAPKFEFITEELAPEGPLTNAPTWIVDPIDGTMSFVHKSFDCCISIGLSVGKVPVLGVIYCPFLGVDGELYTAARGSGAFMNGKPIHVTMCRKPVKAIVFFNMPWRMAPRAIDASVGIRTEMASDRVRAIRSYGAAVLQLAQVACGRGDLYMEPGGKMWDVCAGAVLVEEAGGLVRNLDGSPFTLETHNIVAASSSELADYGAALCRKYNLLHEYFADE